MAALLVVGCDGLDQSFRLYQQHGYLVDMTECASWKVLAETTWRQYCL